MRNGGREVTKSFREIQGVFYFSNGMKRVLSEAVKDADGMLK